MGFFFTLYTKSHLNKIHQPALLEKQSKFPRYNMKCREKHDTTWKFPRSITFSLLHFMLYRGKSITFGTGWDEIQTLPRTAIPTKMYSNGPFSPSSSSPMSNIPNKVHTCQGERWLAEVHTHPPPLHQCQFRLKVHGL